MIELFAAIVVAALAFFACTRWIPHYYARRDMHVPAPMVKRTDLLVGYYGSLREQVAETRGHVNLFWPFQFEGPDKLIKDIRTAAMPTVLDVAAQMTTRNENGKAVLLPDAEERLREFFVRLKSEVVIHNIIGLTPGDEPNSQFESLDVWVDATVIIRRVAAEFPELINVKVWLLLNGAAPMEEWAPHADVVGFDVYNRKSSIFLERSWFPPKKDGEYTRLSKMLRPGQRTFLVPGGAKARDVYEQDPTPFINAAHTYAEVMAVVPFLWSSAVDKDNVITGIQDLPAMREAYTAAGRAIVGGA
jgi:hypothetical protein